jgi:hypothetical protein
MEETAAADYSKQKGVSFDAKTFHLQGHEGTPRQAREKHRFRESFCAAASSPTNQPK